MDNITTNDSLLQKVFENSPKKIFYKYHLHQGKCIKGTLCSHSSIVFVTKGRLRITSVCTENEQTACQGSMFFVPRARTLHAYAYEDTILLTCSINVNSAFCQEHPIGELTKYVKQIPEELKRNEIGLLPIDDHLFQEILVTQQVIEDQLDYEDFQNLKRETLLIYIRHLYTNEEKAYFLLPLLNEDMIFLSKVIRIYEPDITAQEFIARSGMSVSSFNRKFNKAFNMSLGKWLLKKKRDDIKSDLIVTNLTIQEIATKHLFTPNHLRKFCKKEFNQSPSEIRESYNGHFQDTEG